MNAETEKVDVLVAMEKAAKELRHWQRDHGEDIRTKDALTGLREARNAVVELTAAAREVTAAFRAIGNDRTIVTPAGLVKRAEEAMTRLDLASNRIGGAA